MLLSVAVIATMGLASCGGAEAESEPGTDSKAEVNNGPSLCDCVNMEDMTEECKTMQDEWKEKYSAASDEEKELMEAEIAACEAEKTVDNGAEAALEAAHLEMEAALEEMSGDMDAVMEEANAELESVLEEANEELDAALKEAMD